MSEEPLKLNARRLGAAALVLYAVGILIVVFGVIIAIGITASAMPSPPPNVPMTPEMARAMAGLVLICIGLIIHIVFSVYAGFKGRSVISRVDLAGWEGLVKNLGRLYFAATLFLVVGVFVIPGTEMLYQNLIIALVASVLLMVSAMLVPSQHQSMTAGVLIIISATLYLFSARIGISEIFPLIGVYPFLSMIYYWTIISAVALMIVGVALIVRGVISQRSVPYGISAIGGIVYSAGLAYLGFSIVSFISGIPSPKNVPGPIASAYWTFYSMTMSGASLVGIAGILGLVALILAMVFIAKTWIPSRVVMPAPVAPSPPPTRELRYCPGCGAPVSPENIYCGS